MTLRHQQIKNPQQLVHFYDGYVIAHDGWVDAILPDTQIESLFRQGYNITPEGNRLFDTIQLWQEVERQNQLVK